jgi:hypothetical protein
MARDGGPGVVEDPEHELTAEGVEGRGLAKGNLRQQNMPRTQDRIGMPSARERIGEVARRDKKVRFTTLMHHVYSLDTLRGAYFGLKREAVPGVDGETWREYGEQLEGNLEDLSERPKRGAYRAKPVRRVFIPKSDGVMRPLGVTTLEDKIVQRATVEVLNQDLRGGLSRLLVRIPAKARPARRAGCALRRDHDEEGELGARSGHS